MSKYSFQFPFYMHFLLSSFFIRRPLSVGCRVRERVNLSYFNVNEFVCIAQWTFKVWLQYILIKLFGHLLNNLSSIRML